jgi:hypothetical protein
VKLRLAFVLLLGCKGGQSYPEAMRILCAADRAPSVLNANPADRNRLMSQEIEATVTNQEVLAWFGELGTLPPAEAGASVADHAKRAGLSGCLGRALP